MTPCGFRAYDRTALRVAACCVLIVALSLIAQAAGMGIAR